jgi:hypothetical protein
LAGSGETVHPGRADGGDIGAGRPGLRRAGYPRAPGDTTRGPLTDEQMAATDNAELFTSIAAAATGATPTLTPSPTAAPPTTALVVEDGTGDLYGCDAGPAEAAEGSPLQDVEVALFTSDLENLIVELTFPEGVGELATTIADSGQLLEVFVNIHDPANPLPPPQS